MKLMQKGIQNTFFVISTIVYYILTCGKRTLCETEIVFMLSAARLSIMLWHSTIFLIGMKGICVMKNELDEWLSNGRQYGIKLQ